MARRARSCVGGLCHHVLNRGNGRAQVFHKDGDYEAFIRLMAEALGHQVIRVLAYILMPNHFHLVLWPWEDGDVSTYMQWLTSAHARRYHQHYQSVGTGHIWQGRFKSFPIEADEHLLAVIRYVERNALRARLVNRAEDWPYSSLRAMTGLMPPASMLHPGPVDRPNNWLATVNQPQSIAEVEAIRRCVCRGLPWGGGPWVSQTRQQLGIGPALPRRGRPPQVVI